MALPGMQLDYYQTLQIHRDATEEEVRSAFRRTALRAHPERNPGRPEAARTFARAAEAYEVLSNPRHRKTFDEYGEEGLKHHDPTRQGAVFGGYVPSDPEVVFQRFFGLANPFEQAGDFGPMQEHQYFSREGARDKCPPQCPAVEARLACTLEEIFHGCEKTVDLEVEVQDAQGHKTGTAIEQLQVPVTRGTKTHTSFKFSRRGTRRDAWVTGDAYVLLVEQPHLRYRRNGDDLVLTHHISLEEALTGFSLTADTLDGRQLTIAVTEVVHPGYVKRVVGEGLPRSEGSSGSGGKGDLLIEFGTTFPAYLTAEQQAEIRRILRASN